MIIKVNIKLQKYSKGWRMNSNATNIFIVKKLGKKLKPRRNAG